MPRIHVLRAALLSGLVAAALRPAEAQQWDAVALLSEMGFTKEQIAQVEAGNFVDAAIQPSSERELVAAFAFLVHEPPGGLIDDLQTGLLDKDDPNTIGFQMIAGAPSPDAFAKLTLQPGAEKRAQEYVNAKPGGPLNLSSQEIERFDALGSGAGVPAVEQAVRSALLARLTAYQARGLAGIAPYALAGGKLRSPADELRSASQAAKMLRAKLPKAFQLLLDYPAGKPPGMQEAYRWSHYRAHGAPTIALTHSLYVPDGDAWVIMHRQFYVSTGYNSEQAVGALLPMQKGSLALYTNRTSTDQVAGLGGSAKRSIGSKLLSSELRALHKKIQAEKNRGG